MVAPLVAEPELFPLWKDFSSDKEKMDQIPEEVSRLTSITRNTTLNEHVSAAYNVAIEKLQWLCRVCKIPLPTYSTVRWLLAWSVMLKSCFLDLLDERRPEALVVLAYYRALVHFCRDSWVAENTGTRLVNATNEYFGPYWEEWIQWPNTVTRSQ